MIKMNKGWYFGKDSGGGDGGGEEKKKVAAIKDFAKWVEGQSEEVRKSFDAHINGLKSALKKERSNVSTLRTEATGLREQLDTAKQAADGEDSELTTKVNALTGERDGLLGQVDALRVKTAVVFQAMKLGFADPEDAFHLLGSQVGSLKKDDDGEPKGVKKILKTLIESKPYLVSKQNGDNIGNASGKKGKAGGKTVKQADPKVRL